MTQTIVNAMTVDLEEYFQVAALSNVVDRDNWATISSRVVRSTNRLLEIFERNNVSATFFCLGWVAEKHPQLVRQIVSAGHEIACHGYSHQLIYTQTPDEFRRETQRAKIVLEDQAGCPVLGYRAATYSITEKSRWALEILAELGFEYDSSIVPVRHDRYGIPSSERRPHKLRLSSGSELTEFPPSTLRIAFFNIPIAGGGYFRLFPYWLTKWGIARLNKVEVLPCSFYIHPWELDPDQPKLEVNWKSRFRHYHNLSVCESRFRQLLADFSFTTMRNVLSQQKLTVFPFRTDSPE